MCCQTLHIAFAAVYAQHAAQLRDNALLDKLHWYVHTICMLMCLLYHCMFADRMSYRHTATTVSTLKTCVHSTFESLYLALCRNTRRQRTSWSRKLRVCYLCGDDVISAHSGRYVSLFPFLLRLLDAASPKLGIILSSLHGVSIQSCIHATSIAVCVID